MESSLYWYNIIIELVHRFRSIIKTLIMISSSFQCVKFTNSTTSVQIKQDNVSVFMHGKSTVLSQSGHQGPVQEWTILGRLLPHSLAQNKRIGAWMLLALLVSRARHFLGNQSVCMCGCDHVCMWSSVYVCVGGGGEIVQSSCNIHCSQHALVYYLLFHSCSSEVHGRCTVTILWQKIIINCRKYIFGQGKAFSAYVYCS